MEEFSDRSLKGAVPIRTDGMPAVVNAQVTRLEDVDTSMRTDLLDDDEEDEPEDEASGDDYKEEERHDSVVVRQGRGTKRVSSIA